MASRGVAAPSRRSIPRACGWARCLCGAMGGYVGYGLCQGRRQGRRRDACVFIDRKTSYVLGGRWAWALTHHRQRATARCGGAERLQRREGRHARVNLSNDRRRHLSRVYVTFVVRVYVRTLRLTSLVYSLISRDLKTSHARARGGPRTPTRGTARGGGTTHDAARGSRGHRRRPPTTGTAYSPPPYACRHVRSRNAHARETCERPDSAQRRGGRRPRPASPNAARGAPSLTSHDTSTGLTIGASFFNWLSRYFSNDSTLFTPPLATSHTSLATRPTKY